MRVLDAGALIALDRGVRDAWSLLAEVHRAGGRPAAPAPILAQAWRSGRQQARLSRALPGIHLVPADGELSRRAGELLGQAGTNDVLDAFVALVAQDRPGWEVLTSDPDDIAHLFETLGIRRTIRRI